MRRRDHCACEAGGGRYARHAGCQHRKRVDAPSPAGALPDCSNRPVAWLSPWLDIFRGGLPVNELIFPSSVPFPSTLPGPKIASSWENKPHMDPDARNCAWAAIRCDRLDVLPVVAGVHLSFARAFDRWELPGRLEVRIAADESGAARVHGFLFLASGSPLRRARDNDRRRLSAFRSRFASGLNAHPLSRNAIPAA